MKIAMANRPLIEEAGYFIQTCYDELGKNESEIHNRMNSIIEEVDETGTYTHTFEELEHGARMAWRNNNRCIGRLFWNTLTVFDARHLETAEDAFNALVDHIEYATNDGKIRPALTVFPAQQNNTEKLRLWNHQLLRYAGYEKDGTIVGDSSSVEFTKQCMELGWKGQETAFDILPIVIEETGNEVKYFEIPEHAVMEVEIKHPEFEGFSDLEAKWYGVPIISDMRLEMGGISYKAAPFNGWYMATEIGARNFTDVDRYNLSFEIAEKIGLDTRRERTLWRDKALTAMTEAVLWSFEAEGVKIVDHYSASLEFLQFCRNEQDVAREVHGHWPWLVPPIGGSATPLFLDNWKDSEIKPALVMQEPVCPS